MIKPTPPPGLFVKAPIAPHLLFFWIYNLIYFLPLLIVLLWGYSGGGAADEISLDNASLFQMSVVYFEGVFAFTFGSFAVALINKVYVEPNSRVSFYPKIKMGTPERIVVVSVLVLFIGAKAALIPKGVYHVYAADSGAMTGGIWSFSTVCAELMVFAALLVVLSDAKHNVGMFSLMSVFSGISLLHGTRIIFIVTVMAAVFYTYVRGVLSIGRILFFGPLLFVAVLLMTYAVFVSRSGANATLSFNDAVSPIVYESLFSQLSLKSVVSSSDFMNSTGAFPDFIADEIISATPRALLPQKDSLPYLNQFAYLSPLGAFNGYAAGIIYFGVFWPAFYVFLGGFGSWLHAKAQRNAYYFVLYAFYAANVLLRFMRDGYTIPIKIFINVGELLLALIVFKTVLNGLRSKVIKVNAL